MVVEVLRLEPGPEEIRTQLRRILESPAFTRSPRLSRFLEYAVERTIEGQADGLKEYRIGTEVFGRGHSFDPRVDTIVRTQAHRLRALLHDYYAGNPSATVVIDFAKGSYVPVFRRPVAGGRQDAVPVPSARTSAASKGRRHWFALAWLIVAAGIASAALVMWAAAARGRTAPANQEPLAVFTMDLSPHGVLDVDHGALVFSPSGRSAVFPFLEKSGVRRLWLRNLASAVSRPLEGTEEAYIPFWSPDETRIGFFQKGRLKTYRVSDGFVRDLAEAPFGRGATWNSRGIILYAPHSSGRIYQIPEQGGTPAAATELNREREENGHRWPVFLPDGQRFFFHVRSRQAEHSGLMMGSLSSRETAKLASHQSHTRLAQTPKGDYLLYVREGAARARRFDLRSGRLSGEEEAIVQGVRQANMGATFSFVDGHFLAYWDSEFQKTALNLYDRNGRLAKRLTPGGFHLGVTLDADASMLAVETGNEANGSVDIYVTELANVAPRRFTFSGGSYPVWGRGKETLFYLGYGGSLRTLNSKRIGSSGEERQLWKPPNTIIPTDASLDGRWLVIQEDRPDTLNDVSLLPLDPITQQVAGRPVPVRKTKFNENHGSLSRDGQLLAYVSDESGRREVYVAKIRRDGQLLQYWKVSAAGGCHPRWRMDGRELFYLSQSRALMSVPVEGQPGSVSFGAPSKLFDTLAFGASSDSRSPYFPVQNGRQFVINTQEVDAAALPVHVITGWTELLGRSR